MRPLPDMGRPGVWMDRGNHAKARDLYDLCAVADAEPDAIQSAARFLSRHRHGATFLMRLHERSELAEAEFDAIDAIGFRRSFADCLLQARRIIEPLL